MSSEPWVVGAARGLLDVLFDVRCLGCARPGTTWCAPCLRAVWQPLGLDRTDGLHVVSAAGYDREVRAAVIAHKERGQLSLARPLGALLAWAVAAGYPLPAVTLVPCPSSGAATRARGHDHARRLASRGARSLRGVADARVETPLRMIAPAPDQVGLSLAERLDNRRNTLRAGPVPRGTAPVIIVDDVTTSGSTLTEAARALHASGWPVVGAAVVARAGPQMGVAATGGLG